MSNRERREAKAERLREWADRREATGKADLAKADELSEQIPFGQPILVGHHSEAKARRDADRIHDGVSRGVANLRKADEFRRRADEIERQAERSIYSDDEDAAEKLRRRIAELEQHRDAMKRANTIARKGGDWRFGLDAQMLTAAEKNFQFWPGGTEIPFPDVKNVTANIARNRKRLAQMDNE